MANLTAGATQTATVPIRIVPSGLSCGIRVFLTSDAAGAIIKAQSSIVSFSSTGSLQSVVAPLVAPAVGTYYVCVAVLIHGISVGVWASGTVTATTALADLSGVVSDASTGLPLSGVKVTIAGVFAYTNTSGYYSFTGLTPGSYSIVFEKSGYNTLTL